MGFSGVTEWQCMLAVTILPPFLPEYADLLWLQLLLWCKGLLYAAGHWELQHTSRHSTQIVCENQVSCILCDNQLTFKVIHHDTWTSGNQFHLLHIVLSQFFKKFPIVCTDLVFRCALRAHCLFSMQIPGWWWVIRHGYCGCGGAFWLCLLSVRARGWDCEWMISVLHTRATLRDEGMCVIVHWLCRVELSWRGLRCEELVQCSTLTM